MSALAERFETAAVRAPLSAAQRQELDRVLARATALEDLPGWWQAALLAAEQNAPGPQGDCCGHH